MIHLPLIQAVKITLSGKIGACLMIAAPIMLAVEVKDHIDAIITATTTILVFVGGVFFLKKGQNKLIITVDGRMTEIVEMTKKIAHAAGKEEGLAEVLDLSKQAARAEGKEQERVEARERHELGKWPVDVVVKNTKVEPVPTETQKKTL